MMKMSSYDTYIKTILFIVSFLFGWWLVPSKIRIFHEENRFLPVHVYQREYKKGSGPSIFKGQSVEFFWEISPFDDMEEESTGPVVDSTAPEQQWARFLDVPVQNQTLSGKVPYIPDFVPPFYRKSEEFKTLFKDFSTKKSETLAKQSNGVVLLTYYRSGSSFLGQILNQHPDVFYHFEPLFPFSRDCSGDTPAFKNEKVENIERILRCDMPNWREIFMNKVRF